MASRREFLQAGIAVSLLPATVPPVAASAADTSSKAPAPQVFYKVIFDERFPASVAFGEEWKARGAAVHAIRGDITDL